LPASAKARRLSIVHVCPPSFEQKALGDALRAAFDGVALTWLADPGEALALLQGEARPDLLLFLDTAVRQEGRALIALAKRIHPALRVAVYGTMGRVECDRWLNAGCDGVLARDVEPRWFIEALRFVIAGNSYVAPQLIAGGADPLSACSFLGACGLGSPLFDEIPAPVVVLLADRYLHLNETAASLLGYDRDTLLQKNPADVVAEPHRDFIGRALQDWGAGAPVDRDFVVALRHKDGALVWVASTHKMINVGGRPAVLLFCTDVTARLKDQDQARLLAKSPRALAADLVLCDRAATAIEQRAAANTAPALTARQQQVLELLAGGASNKRIAGQLGISEATAKLHVHRLLRALQARNRAQAVGHGRRFGLLTA
jgi:PAS domain S-box-containing protein